MKRNDQRQNERESLEAAMNRLLAGEPAISDGTLTATALVVEAGFAPNQRYLLTHKHLDVKAEFYRRIADVYGKTPREQRVAQQLENAEAANELLKNKIDKLARERATLIRLLTVLNLENEQLRGAENVTAIRTRSSS